MRATGGFLRQRDRAMDDATLPDVSGRDDVIEDHTSRGRGTGRTAGSTRRSPEELLLVVNARAGGDDRLLAAATDAFEQSGARTRIVEIDASDAHRDVLREYGPHSDGIVVAGGDGTISRLLPDLVSLSRPLGILPAGTANDLARTLKIPDDGAAAARIVLEGATRRIDLGLANGIYFCNAAGIGASVSVSRELDRLDKATLGVLAYARAAWRVLRRTSGFRTRIRGGEALGYRGRATQVTVANGVHYGGGMTIHESATIDDGALDVLVVRPRPLMHYVCHFFAFRHGRYDGNAPVWSARTQSIEVRTRHRRACALDGEVRTRTPVEFSVDRNVLEVFAPAGQEGES